MPEKTAIPNPEYYRLVGIQTSLTLDGLPKYRWPFRAIAYEVGPRNEPVGLITHFLCLN